MAAATLTSVILSDAVQKDGRRLITELHTDQYGVSYPRGYMCAALFDAVSQLSADATQLIADLAAGEINTNVNAVISLGSLASPTLQYSSATQNFAALRLAYATATQTQAVMIGDFLNTLTDTQLQNAFGLTAAQVTTLRTNKLQPAATLAASIRSTTGQ